MGPSGDLHDTYGGRRCSGGRTRTLNNWTRTSRVADYTTPEWVGVQISRAAHDPSSPSWPGQGARCFAASRWKDASPGAPVPGVEPGSEVLGMHRWSLAWRQSPWPGSSVPPCWPFGAPAGPRPGPPAWSSRSPPARASRPARRSPSAAGASRSRPAAAPDLVRHRVHRRRPGPGEPRHRHPSLRHHARPGPQGQPNGHLQLPLPPHDAGSSATATAGPPGTPPASSASGPPREWAPSCGSPSRRPAAPPPSSPAPPPSSTTTTTAAG